MNLFTKTPPPPEPPQPDSLLSDLLRGEDGRHASKVFQSHSYFENPERLAQIGFKDMAGQSYLGVVGGTTQRVVRPDGRAEYVTLGGTPIAIDDDRHFTLIAGSRAGKGRSCLLPSLLSNRGSTVVIDPKGELASISSRFRAEEMEHDVCIIDPFGITPAHCAVYRKQFNPLEELTEDNPTVVEDAGLISDALIAPLSDKDSHWDETAKAFIEAVILYVCFGFFTEGERNLLTVAYLISGRGKSIESLLNDMLNCDALDGRIAAGAQAIAEKPENERGSVISNARKNLKFIEYQAIERVLAYNDFSLLDLKSRPMTVYLVLPATRLSSCRGLLRLFVNLTLSAIEKSPAKPPFPCQLILDEMAVLGRMSELENAIGQMAGMGLRITTVLQDLGQLKALYKDRYETFLANSGIIQCFGLVDAFSSEWVSKYLGKTTIRVAERNSTTVDQKTQGNSGVNYRSHSQELLSPDEVRRYFARDDHKNRQLILVPGKRPWITQRAHYDSHSLFTGRFDDWR